MLLRRAQDEVYNYFMCDQDSGRKQIIKKLEEMALAAREASLAWACLGHDLHRALRSEIEGRGPESKGGISAAHLVERAERSERLQHVLDEELGAIAPAAKRIIEALRRDQTRHAAEYALILRLCRAWSECVGKKPAQSRGERAKSGERTPAPFERFVAAAIAPRTIAEHVMRDAIEEFSATESARDKPGKKIR
jgi:hypothetical protein